MKTVVHHVVLQSQERFHGKVPPHHLGLLLAEVPLAVREAISMALRNRSTVQGRRPAWLDRASDVRFVGHEGDGNTVLVFEAPTLGEAAGEIYVQKILFPEISTRPLPEDSGFDVFGDVLADVGQRNADSGRFDSPLLNRITRFQKVIAKRSPFTEIDIISRRFENGNTAKLTSETVESAKSLLGKTPTSQRVRIVGQLDGLEASTQRFSVLLDTGEKIIGVFADDQIETIHDLWRRRILVLGTAIYRASGRLLRVDADAVKPGDNEPSIFSRVPIPSHAKLDVSKFRKLQGPRSGIAAIIGEWPGDETDDEIDAALERLS
jgi:hypothetical protein